MTLKLHEVKSIVNRTFIYKKKKIEINTYTSTLDKHISTTINQNFEKYLVTSHTVNTSLPSTLVIFFSYN